MFRSSLFMTFAALVLVLVAACAPSRHLVNLQPQLPVTDSANANNIAVAVSIEDSRSNAIIGKRGDAEVSGAPPVTEVLQTVVSEALKKRGFVIASTGAENAKHLHVTVRALTFDASTGQWRGRAELSTRANFGNSDYKSAYSVEKEGKTVVTIGIKDMENTINQMLSETLDKMFHDSNLVKFLSQ